MKRIKVKGFLEDIKKTGGIPAFRSRMIDEAPNDELPCEYPVNALARMLHPVDFPLCVKECKAENGFMYVKLSFADSEDDIYFKCGQNLGIRYFYDGAVRFSALPVMSISGRKTVETAFCRKADENAYRFFSDGALSSLTGVSFEGLMTYNSIRDKGRVIILGDEYALSNAVSLADGIKRDYTDTEVKLFGDCENSAFFSFIKEKAETELRAVNNIENEAYGSDTTVFIAGCNDFCKKYAPLFCGKAANVRTHPVALIDEYESVNEYTCTVIYRGESFTALCKEGERLSDAFMRADIPCDVRCSDGECGYCRCRLLQGDVKTLKSGDDRRTGADIKYGYIHPCSVTAVSDITAEL